MAARSSVSHVEIKGQALLPIIEAMALIHTRALKILAAHGLTAPESEKWYPMSRALEVYEQIRTDIGPNTTKAVGRKLPDIVGLPPNVRTLEEAFGFIQVGYRMHHRGPGDIGGYHYEPAGERRGRMVCDNPYPCELDEGILETVGEKFRPKDSLWVRVEHQPGSCRKNGDTACRYSITW